MRTVTRASRSSAARAQRRNCARVGSPYARAPYCTFMESLCTRRAGFGAARARLVVFVRIDDALHQRMAHDDFRAEMGERDAAHLLEHLLRLDQPALLAASEVDLGDVAVDHRFAAEPDARQEHLHL